MSSVSLSRLRGPIFTLTHGGGPLPLLGSQPELVEIWSKHADQIAAARVDAIVIISAHYKHDGGAAKVLGLEQPKIIFDYQGFPAEAYKFQWPAPGHPALAKRIVDAMRKMPQLKDAELDLSWGFDHGTFVPGISMFKHASVPVVPISVSSSDDAAISLAVGEAVRTALTSQAAEQPVRDEDFALPNVAVIGSGSMFHNFQRMSSSMMMLGNSNNNGKSKKSGSAGGADFHAAFTKLMTDKSISPAQRKEALLKWHELPGAREYQPAGASDHMMPLLTVAAVAAYQPASETVTYSVFNVQSSDFVWK